MFIFTRQSWLLSVLQLRSRSKRSQCASNKLGCAMSRPPTSEGEIKGRVRGWKTCGIGNGGNGTRFRTENETKREVWTLKQDCVCLKRRWHVLFNISYATLKVFTSLMSGHSFLLFGESNIGSLKGPACSIERCSCWLQPFRFILSFLVWRTNYSGCEMLENVERPI